MGKLRRLRGFLLAAPLLISTSACAAESDTLQASTRSAQPLALTTAAIAGIRDHEPASTFASDQGIELQPAEGGTLLGRAGSTRLTLFPDATGQLTRLDLYFSPSEAPSREELEAITGTMEVFQQSKNSRALTEIPRTETRGGVLVYAEFFGREPSADSIARSLSVRKP